MEALPLELLARIVYYLDGHSMVRLSCTCTKLRMLLCHSPVFTREWKAQYARACLELGPLSVHRPRYRYCRFATVVDRHGYRPTLHPVAPPRRCRDTTHYYTETLECPQLKDSHVTPRKRLLRALRTRAGVRRRRRHQLQLWWAEHVDTCASLGGYPWLDECIARLLKGPYPTSVTRLCAQYEDSYNIADGERGWTRAAPAAAVAELATVPAIGPDTSPLRRHSLRRWHAHVGQCQLLMQKPWLRRATRQLWQKRYAANYERERSRITRHLLT